MPRSTRRNGASSFRTRGLRRGPRHLASPRTRPQPGSVAYGCGIEFKFEQLYFEIIKLDPTTTGHFFAEIAALSTADIIPYDEFVERASWAEPAGPRRLRQRSARQVGNQRRDVRRLPHPHRRPRPTRKFTAHGVVVPHIRRAVLIGRLIDLRQTEAAAFADTFDAGAAHLLVDGAARSRQSSRPRPSDSPISCAPNGGRLVAGDPEDRPASPRRLRRCRQRRQGNRLARHGASLRRQGRRTPRRPRAARPRARGGAPAPPTPPRPLLVHKAALETPSPPEVIARHFKLTPSRLRMLLAIVEVGGIPEVAEALGNRRHDRQDPSRPALREDRRRPSRRRPRSSPAASASSCSAATASPSVIDFWSCVAEAADVDGRPPRPRACRRPGSPAPWPASARGPCS